jgi:hypothetical protein
MSDLALGRLGMLGVGAGEAAEGGAALAAAAEILSGPVGWAILAVTAGATAWIVLSKAQEKSNEDLKPTAQDEPCATCGDSPEIKPDDLKGKTKEEIEQTAKEKGLKEDPNRPGKYKDPVTGKERIRIDPGHVDPTTGKPYDNPNAAGPHVHGYPPEGPGGGKIVDPETGDPHFPLK